MPLHQAPRQLLQLLRHVVQAGLRRGIPAALEALHQLLDQVIASKKIKDLQKAKISEIVAETDAKLIEGGNEEINLTYALHFIASVIRPRGQ